LAPAARAGTAASIDPTNTAATPAVKPPPTGLMVTKHYHPVTASLCKPTRWADWREARPVPSPG
jgi:hypothetical protein